MSAHHPKTWPGGPYSTEDELEEMVSARMEPKAILDRPEPSLLWVIIDEAVLRRRIGGPKIMYDQLSRLAAQAKRPSITVQVLPGEVGAHVGLTGGFAIASGNGSDTVYIESPDEGQTAEAASVVAKKDREGPALVFASDEWRAFLDGVRAAEFDLR